jgi:2-C-methyl-D-erythritol 4-phosphate cytidylyltransferase
MPAVAIVVAAGRGERLGSEGPKALVACAGRPLLSWSLDALHAAGLPIVVALPAGVAAPEGTRGVAGGAERSHSVRNALAAVDTAADVVLVHDAARPLLSVELVRACLDAMQDGVDAAIAAARLTDTVKEAEGDRVVRTLDRSRLWAVQTPQVFRRTVLEDVLSQPDDVLAAATDDASLIELAGGSVRLVPAPRWNLKVTLPEDLQLAELLLAARAE